MACAPCWIFDRPARLDALAERARDRCNASKSYHYHAEKRGEDAPVVAALDRRHRIARSRAHRLRRLAEASGASLAASRRGRPAAMAG